MRCTSLLVLFIAVKIPTASQVSEDTAKVHEISSKEDDPERLSLESYDMEPKPRFNSIGISVENSENSNDFEKGKENIKIPDAVVQNAKDIVSNIKDINVDILNNAIAGKDVLDSGELQKIDVGHENGENSIKVIIVTTEHLQNSNNIDTDLEIEETDKGILEENGKNSENLITGATEQLRNSNNIDIDLEIEDTDKEILEENINTDLLNSVKLQNDDIDLKNGENSNNLNTSATGQLHNPSNIDKDLEIEDTNIKILETKDLPDSAELVKVDVGLDNGENIENLVRVTTGQLQNSNNIDTDLEIEDIDKEILRENGENSESLMAGATEPLQDPNKINIDLEIENTDKEILGENINKDLLDSVKLENDDIGQKNRENSEDLIRSTPGLQNHSIDKDLEIEDKNLKILGENKDLQDSNKLVTVGQGLNNGKNIENLIRGTTGQLQNPNILDTGLEIKDTPTEIVEEVKNTDSLYSATLEKVDEANSQNLPTGATRELQNINGIENKDKNKEILEQNIDDEVISAELAKINVGHKNPENINTDDIVLDNVEDIAREVDSKEQLFFETDEDEGTKSRSYSIGISAGTNQEADDYLFGEAVQKKERNMNAVENEDGGRAVNSNVDSKNDFLESKEDSDISTSRLQSVGISYEHNVNINQIRERNMDSKENGEGAAAIHSNVDSKNDFLESTEDNDIITSRLQSVGISYEQEGNNNQIQGRNMDSGENGDGAAAVYSNIDSKNNFLENTEDTDINISRLQSVRNSYEHNANSNQIQGRNIDSEENGNDARAVNSNVDSNNDFLESTEDNDIDNSRLQSVGVSYEHNANGNFGEAIKKKGKNMNVIENEDGGVNSNVDSKNNFLESMEDNDINASRLQSVGTSYEHDANSNQIQGRNMDSEENEDDARAVNSNVDSKNDFLESTEDNDINTSRQQSVGVSYEHDSVNNRIQGRNMDSEENENGARTVNSNVDSKNGILESTEDNDINVPRLQSVRNSFEQNANSNQIQGRNMDSEENGGGARAVKSNVDLKNDFLESTEDNDINTSRLQSVGVNYEHDDENSQIQGRDMVSEVNSNIDSKNGILESTEDNDIIASQLQSVGTSYEQANSNQIQGRNMDSKENGDGARAVNSNVDSKNGFLESTEDNDINTSRLQSVGVSYEHDGENNQIQGRNMDIAENVDGARTVNSNVDTKNGIPNQSTEDNNINVSRLQSVGTSYEQNANSNQIQGRNMDSEENGGGARVVNSNVDSQNDFLESTEDIDINSSRLQSVGISYEHDGNNNQIEGRNMNSEENSDGAKAVDSKGDDFLESTEDKSASRTMSIGISKGSKDENNWGQNMEEDSNNSNKDRTPVFSGLVPEDLEFKECGCNEVKEKKPLYADCYVPEWYKDPMCGSDGQIYTNRYHFKCENKQRKKDSEPPLIYTGVPWRKDNCGKQFCIKFTF